jgi:hypothetical protein
MIFAKIGTRAFAAPQFSVRAASATNHCGHPPVVSNSGTFAGQPVFRGVMAGHFLIFFFHWKHRLSQKKDHRSITAELHFNERQNP